MRCAQCFRLAIKRQLGLIFLSRKKEENIRLQNEYGPSGDILNVHDIKRNIIR